VTSGPIPKEIADDLKARGLDKDPAAATSAPAAAEFKPYNSPDGVFRVNFPGEPRVNKFEAAPAAATAGAEVYSIDKLPRTFSVSCARFTEDRDPAKELEKLVASNVRAGIEGKVVESKDVTMKGRAGKDVTISLDDARFRRARFFVGEKDIYQVVCDYPKNDVDAKNGTAFVESFELLKD
jgi:hypothetical protein